MTLNEIEKTHLILLKVFLPRLDDKVEFASRMVRTTANKKLETLWIAQRSFAVLPKFPCCTIQKNKEIKILEKTSDWLVHNLSFYNNNKTKSSL